MPPVLPPEAKASDVSWFADATADEIKSSRRQCYEFLDAQAESGTGKLADMDIAEAWASECDIALSPRPTSRRTALLRGSNDNRASRPGRSNVDDHRIREVEAAGQRVAVNYADDRRWQYDDSSHEPDKFRGWSERDHMQAFAEDFVAINRGERVIHNTITTDTVSLGIDSYTEPRIWAYIFQQSVLGRLGVGSMQMPAPMHKVLIVKEKGSAGWVAEGERIPTTKNSLSAVEMCARKIGTILPMSRELLEDASNVATTMVSHMSMTMASAIDDAMIGGNGSGTGLGGEPLGLVNKLSLPQMDSAAGQIIYDQLIDLIYEFHLADYPGDLSNLRILWNPTDEKSVSKLKDNEGRYLEPPRDVAMVPRFTSTKIPYNSAAASGEVISKVTMLDPGSILFGQRRSLRIEQSNNASFTDTQTGKEHSAFQEDLAAWKLTWRGDIAVVREQFVRQLLIKRP